MLTTGAVASDQICYSRFAHVKKKVREYSTTDTHKIIQTTPKSGNDLHFTEGGRKIETNTNRVSPRRRGETLEESLSLSLSQVN